MLLLGAKALASNSTIITGIMAFAIPLIGFKEWASVVLALERGLQTLILRRGGISEESDAFEPKHSRFALFPTYFHQQRSGLREEYAALIDEAFRLEPRAGTVRIGSVAQVTSQARIDSLDALSELHGRHVYRPELVEARFRGLYGKGLYALGVHIELLPEPLELPLLSEYGGCKSWVELELRP